jgi:hypothetical protein
VTFLLQRLNQLTVKQCVDASTTSPFIGQYLRQIGGGSIDLFGRWLWTCGAALPDRGPSRFAHMLTPYRDRLPGAVASQLAKVTRASCSVISHTPDGHILAADATACDSLAVQAGADLHGKMAGVDVGPSRASHASRGSKGVLVVRENKLR